MSACLFVGNSSNSKWHFVYCRFVFRRQLKQSMAGRSGQTTGPVPGLAGRALSKGHEDARREAALIVPPSAAALTHSLSSAPY